MKKIYSLFFVLTFSAYAFSQALPNASFDNWTTHGTYDDPDNWNTLNPSTYILGAITAQKATGADIHSGSAALKLITLYIAIIAQNANGLATTGTINTTAMTIDGGIAYTLRPDSVTGWYKCDPQGGDNGFVDFSLLDATGTDTVGFAEFLTPTTAVTAYTYFSVPIVYHNANTPALSRCVMSSSAGFTSVVNSTMFIDDLGLVFNPNGVHEPIFGKNIVNYNSVTNKLNVFSQQHSAISVVDVTGKEVFKSNIKAGNSEFILTNLPLGLYVYFITDDERKNTSAGKFMVE